MKIARINRIALLALMLASTAAFARVNGSFSRTLKVSGPVDLTVQTGSGDIVVRSGEVSDVQVNAKIRAGEGGWFDSSGGTSAEEKVRRIEQSPPIQQNGNTIVIGRIEDRELQRNVSISYEITVPAETTLHAKTGSGDQTISGISGPVEIQTGSGNIKATRIGGDAKMNTGSGDIVIDGIKGVVSARTGSGNVTANGASGNLNAETGSGDVRGEGQFTGNVVARTGSGNVHLDRVIGSLEAHTGSGDIVVNGEAKGNWTAHSGSGNIELHLPAQAAFEVDAHSSSGGVTVNHPITVQGQVKPNRVQGKVNGGGALLSLQSGSGDIRID